MIRVAERMVNNPIGVENCFNPMQPTEFCKISYEDRIITLAIQRLGNSIYVAGAIQNPKDKFGKWDGRVIAEQRLWDYFQFGTVKRHKDGRNANHFMLVMDEGDIQKGWRVEAARRIYEGSFLGGRTNMNTVTCCGGC